MTDSSDLVEQQILLHEARLKRVDELFEMAREAGNEDEETDPLLAALESERDTLAGLLRRMRGDAPESWDEVVAEHFGPLAIWEALARVLERAIERREAGSQS